MATLDDQSDPVRTSYAAGTMYRAARWAEALDDAFEHALALRLEDRAHVSDAHVNALERARDRWTFAEREIARLITARLGELADLLAPFDDELSTRLSANDPAPLSAQS